ncbi:MAG: hypothetical protein ABIT10_00990 [Alteraurantiacibacter sp.]
MAEQWIPTSKALDLGIDRYSLCTRLHKGLLTARADSVHRGSESANSAKVPKEFWWANGQAALEQDWEAGDFSTWINNKEHWQAFGVRFPLSGLLDMLEIEKRPAIRRSFSVTGRGAWMPAREARAHVFSKGVQNAGVFLIEQARLGFVAAKAVEAWGVAHPNNFLSYDWEEREWEVPVWFWERFARASGKDTSWEIGQFRGEGLSPMGSRLIEASGVHFLRESVEACFQTNLDHIAGVEEKRKGRKPKYDWPAAIVATYGKIERGDLKPSQQSDVEDALVAYFMDADGGPGESTVRPYAKLIWEESQKP